jgi:hypothetical protein
MSHPLLRTASLTVVAALTSSALLGLSGPAEARPRPSLGPVSGLGMSVTHTDAYVVTADWDALSGATKYAVRMSGGGTRLATGTVTTTTWQATTTLPAGTQVSVTVTPYNGRRKGKAATVSEMLPDVTAPRAAYSVHREQGDPTSGSVTIHRDLLEDDLSSVSGITQSIAWDRGQDPVAWPSSQTDISHDYGNAEAVHHPVVTVEDAAHNTATYELTVAVRDSLAPLGSYTAGPASGFARWTEVAVSELDVSDNLSADADIVRTVDWGDGTVESWSPELRHVFAVAGTFQPRVRLRDEAGNETGWLSTSTIDVVADITAPLTTLRVPTMAANRVASWSTLRGRLDDGKGVGAKTVAVKVAELRRGHWFGYKASSSTWVKAASKRGALRNAEGTAAPTATRRWTLAVNGLRTGTLVVKYRGADLLGNRNPWTVREQRLTRR